MEVLRLVRGQNLRRCLEFVSDSFQQWVAVLHNNGSIKTVTFYSGVCCADSETTGLRKFLKPSKKQTVTIGFAPVAVITNIKQYVKIFSKELVNYSQNGLFDFGVVRRPLMFNFLNDKLERFATTQWLVNVKVYSVMDTLRRNKIIAAIFSYCYLIWRSCIQRLQGENHSVTIVPVSPICLQRSSKRFSAARLISSECLKRAKASSYVTFFVSMVLVFLTFHAAKVSI